MLLKKELENEYGLSKSMDSLGHIENKKVSEDSKWMIPYKNTLWVGTIVTILVTIMVETLFSGTLDLVVTKNTYLIYNLILFVFNYYFKIFIFSLLTLL